MLFINELNVYVYFGIVQTHCIYLTMSEFNIRVIVTDGIITQNLIISLTKNLLPMLLPHTEERLLCASKPMHPTCYAFDSTAIRLRPDYDVSRAPASIRRDSTRAKNEHVSFSS